MNKVLIITAPSGSGKTTIVKKLLVEYPIITFSISACTRNPRPGEEDGKDYYFLTEEAFKQKINEAAFLEWEMVYTGKYYGTLKSEMTRIWNEHKVPLVDIDVQGALNVKQLYGENAVSIFIKAPSIAELRRRLEKRGTETPDFVEERIEKAKDELTFADKFDYVVVNDVLEDAVQEIINIVNGFVKD